MDSFAVLNKNGMLEEFCKRNDLSPKKVDKIIEAYVNVEKNVDEHNDRFVENSLISEKEYEVIDARTKKSVTIQNEILRSHQEVEIANFLYLNNIDYEYEPIYPYDIMYARKPYTPDFATKQDDKVALIEHFGITESGENDRFSPPEIERYKKAVNDKILLHRQHGTTLIYTFSAYNDRRPVLTHLKEQLDLSALFAALYPISRLMVINWMILTVCTT